MMKLPRTLHKLYADLMGYFWKPCPECGICFGGHEVVHSKFVFIHKDHERACVCPDCTRKQETFARDMITDPLMLCKLKKGEQIMVEVDTLNKAFLKMLESTSEKE